MCKGVKMLYTFYNFCPPSPQWRGGVGGEVKRAGRDKSRPYIRQTYFVETRGRAAAFLN